MNIVGVDVGTMFLVVAKHIAETEKVEFNTMRNVFLPVSGSSINFSEIVDTKIDYIKSVDDNGNDQIYIISEDAYKFSNIFNYAVRRPMSKGVVSSSEIDAVDIISMMIEKLVGGRTKDGYCVYSVPERAIDVESSPVLYHEKVFGKIFDNLGYKSSPLNESMAIIYSECKDYNFNGIAISFGSGLTNVVCAYRGTPVLKFSVSRAGDWVDKCVADSLGIIPNRVTSIKEKPDFDLLGASLGKNKKEKRIVEAINFYYMELIEYVLNVIIKKFNENSQGFEIDETIPIIVSGGTSKPKGFISIFNDIFDRTKDFPYEVSHIIASKDPLNSVAMGCLLYALWEHKKLKKGINS